MITVAVQLHSAITGKSETIALMKITNDGSGSAQVGNYDVATVRGRDAATLIERLAQGPFTRAGKVHNYPRTQHHVWNLVARALKAAGYE